MKNGRTLLLNTLSKTATVCALSLLLSFASPAPRAQVVCLPGIPCPEATPPSDPPSSGPNAPKASEAVTPSGGNSCDADFMNQIYARAFIEGVRENAINEVVVRKPDSVLEYTCFDQYLEFTATDGAAIFSENPRWQGLEVPIGGTLGGVPVPSVVIDVFLGDDRMENSLNALVMTSLNDYIDQNFFHDFLGGTATGLNNTIRDTIIGNPEYLCDFMFVVHQLAKCNDFGLDDPFLTFSELVGAANDPRALPQECTGTAMTDELIALANNDDFAFASTDPVEAFLNLMNLEPVDCEPPIPTGVIAAQKEVELDFFNNPTVTLDIEYPDHVCPNPGCFFNHQNDEDPGNDTCE